MNSYEVRGFRRMQTAGCFVLALVLVLMCLMPVLLVDAMHGALQRLHLSSAGATLALVGIVLGSLINLPLFRVTRDAPQLYEMRPMLGVWTWVPQVSSPQYETVVAVNVGGCVIPVLVALWQLRFVAASGGWPLAALGIAVIANVAACYRVARPIRGLGIGMPWFVSPLVAVGITWLLLAGDEYAALRPAVAFVAGVAGPVVGADLLHLKDLRRISTGMMSIGGAGTFDGIVLSSIVAALLA
ncbi:MAG: DUF1614 domain-containing protein [Pirellulales bacterium]|nr:DUF1614 domain-containing protein [Pirellulales bacterium]